jgi:outer membrane protein assembly factor BamB
MKRAMIMFSLLLMAVSVVALANGYDWPRWRGPQGDGISRETGWNPQALNGSPNILWKKNVGRGHSAVSVAGGRLFTMGDRSVKQGGKDVLEEVVYCLDARTGKEIWKYAYPSRYRRFPGPASTPTVDGERIYTIGREGVCYCFNAQNGKVIWKRDLAGEGFARAPQWGFCASPQVVGDRVIMNAGQAGIALDKKTGKTLWANEPGGGWLPTPYIFSRNGKQVALVSALRKLYLLNVQDGKVIWERDWQSDMDPTVIGEKVYLAGGGRGNGNMMLDISSGQPQVTWETGNMANGFQSPVVIGNHVYGFGWLGREQMFACIDLQTGEVKWQEDMGDWGALIGADGKLIIIDGDGDLIVAEANPTRYSEISRAKVIPLRNWQSYGRDEPRCCWTNPVLAHGLVYARDTYGEIVCVDMTN